MTQRARSDSEQAQNDQGATSPLSSNDALEKCSHEWELMRAALVALMYEAKAFLEPAGRTSRAMDQARCALKGQEPRRWPGR